jgi:hypothetical protein
MEDLENKHLIPSVAWLVVLPVLAAMVAVAFVLRLPEASHRNLQRAIASARSRAQNKDRQA